MDTQEGMRSTTRGGAGRDGRGGRKMSSRELRVEVKSIDICSFSQIEGATLPLLTG